MAAPVGLDREQVVDAAAAALATLEHPDALALRDVADRLGVRPQSLYAHVDGLAGLQRALALRGLRALADRLSAAAIGRSGADAVERIVRAWVDFALEQPGLYAAGLRPPGDDPDLLAAVEAATLPLRLVLGAAGLDEEETTHRFRTIFSAVHGYVSLRRDGLFTLAGDPDRSLDHLIRTFARQVEQDDPAARRRPGGRRR